MSVKPYNPDAIKQIIELYSATFPEAPTRNDQIYISDDAMMWDGYIAPVEKLNNLFSDFFRFSKHKKVTSIKAAQEIGGTDELCIQQIAFFITDILVNEKTHGGLFATMLKNGVIERVVNRMEALLASTTADLLVAKKKPWWRLW